MAFWQKAKQFFTDMFYEDVGMEKNENMKPLSDTVEINTNDSTSNITVSTGSVGVKPQEPVIKEMDKETDICKEVEEQLVSSLGSDHTALKGVLSDFFEGHDIVANNLPPVPYEVQYSEGLRVKAISQQIAKANGLKESAVWTEMSGNTRIQRSLVDEEETSIICNAAFTSKLTYDQLAFVIARQYARIYCKHEEEERLLNENFYEADVTQYYRFRMAEAVHRKNTFEEDKVGLQFACKAGYNVPNDLEFLRMDESIFGLRAKNLNMFGYTPTVTERQIVLASDTVDMKPFNKDDYNDYISHLTKLVTNRYKYFSSIRSVDGKYVGLTPQEFVNARNSAADIEENFIKRFMPSMQEQNKKIKEWMVTHIPIIAESYPTPLKFKNIKNLHFNLDIVKNTPARIAFAKEVTEFLEFMKQGVNPDENQVGGKPIYFRNLQNVSLRNKKLKRTLGKSQDATKGTGDMTDDGNTGR